MSGAPEGAGGTTQGKDHSSPPFLHGRVRCRETPAGRIRARPAHVARHAVHNAQGTRLGNRFPSAFVESTWNRAGSRALAGTCARGKPRTVAGNPDAHRVQDPSASPFAGAHRARGRVTRTPRVLLR